MDTSVKKEATGNILLRMYPIHRLLISLGFGALTFLCLRPFDLKQSLLFMFVWDAFALSFLVTSWIIFFKCPPTQIRKRAREEDGSRLFVYLIIILASFVSMIMVMTIILTKDIAVETIYLPAAIGGMLLSWGMVHTTFCYHYAHIYYGDAENNTQKHAEGLDFPNEKAPDYMDFVYFSFVIGMTFQVSDVEITSRTIRRLALLHGLVSFGLNTFVVALTVNLIAGLRQ